MSYRIDYRHPKYEPHRNVQTATTPGEIIVTNGGISHTAIYCTYLIVDDSMRIENKEILEEFKHDKYAPSLRAELDSRQERPIHLRQEYPNVEVETNLERNEDGTQKIEGLSISGYVDEQQDWVIRLTVVANCPEAQSLDGEGKPQHCHFTIIVKDDTMGIRQVAWTGTLIVLPGILDEGVE